MSDRPLLDVSGLPNYGFGPRSLTWWGMVGFIVIETTAFVLAVGAYFYLMGQVPGWPPGDLPPDLRYGLLFTAVLLASLVPNLWTKHVVEAQDLRRTRLGLLAMLAVGLLLLVLRGFEFTALNTSWDSSAYGSILWTLMLLHTLHLATDVADTAVLAALMLSHRGTGRRYADCSENAVYWNFVVIAWLPMAALVYGVPRWL